MICLVNPALLVRWNYALYMSQCTIVLSTWIIYLRLWFEAQMQVRTILQPSSRRRCPLSDAANSLCVARPITALMNIFIGPYILLAKSRSSNFRPTQLLEPQFPLTLPMFTALVARQVLITMA